jgi:hypothetical protein
MTVRSCMMVLAFVAVASPARAQVAPQPTNPPPSAQPVPPADAPPDAPPQPTASPPADTQEAPVQSFEEQPAARPEQAQARPPEDVQSFAEATMVSSGPVRFALNAFGDASFRAIMPESGNDSETFSLGTLALLINARLGTHILGTAEAALDTNDSTQQPLAKVERLHIRWQNERFFVIGGRMHTDLGYWNTAYHHGPWLQLTINRPRGVRGESSGGILPIHFVGVEAGLIVPMEPASLTVSGGVGNGRGNTETDIRITRDTNQFKALMLKVECVGLGWPDLRVGASGVYDRIPPLAMTIDTNLPTSLARNQEIDEWIGNGFVAYRGVNLTVIAEGFAVVHKNDTDTFTTADEYVVGGYRIGRVTPYLQLERTDAMGGLDPFYTPQETPPSPLPGSTPQDQTEVIVGTRIDTSVWSAIKAEYSLLHKDGPDTFDHTVTVNWSFGI